MSKININKKLIMRIAIIIVVLLIPIIYSYFYLKAYWDPYGNVDKLPVAIVNLDTGNEDENLGEELVNKLVDKNAVKLDVLDEEQANTALVNQEYYAVITIPKDFTKTLDEAASKDRQVVTITYSPNQKANLIASQILNSVIKTVEKEVTAEINKTTTETLCEKLEGIPDELQEISDGAGQIQDGTTQLADGMEELNSGTSELSSSYSKFNNGVASAYAGSEDLSSGINELATGIDALNSGVSELKEETSNLSSVTDAVDKVADSVDTLDEKASTYVTGQMQVNTAASGAFNWIIAYGNQNPELLNDTTFATLYWTAKNIQDDGTIDALNTGATQLSGGITSLSSAMQQFKLQTAGLSKLSGAITQIQNGTTKLQSGASQLQSGSTSLKNGIGELNTNSNKINNAIDKISDGTQTALNGNQDLLDGVNTFKEEIDNGIADTQTELEDLDGLSDYAEDPVDINEEDYGETECYGLGFAPFFMSISLWVGALMVFIAIYYDPENRFEVVGRHAEHKLVRLGFYVLLAIGQAIVLGFLLKWALGFSVTNIWLYYGSCILVSLVFFSIMQFLIFNFGDVGKFTALILLILQLASSGGTFPLETVPEGFQKLGVVMPMTYSIRLFKEALISIDTVVLTKTLGVLFGIWITFLIGCIIGDTIRLRKIKRQKIEAND